MKHLFASSLIITILSCSNNKNSDEQGTPVIKNSPSPNQYVNPTSDTGTGKIAESTPNESVFPAGTYKSLSDIMKSVFSQGSTRKEVRTVQGEPDYTDSDGIIENWYYGHAIVQFKASIVGGVNNADGKLKYVEYFALALSPDAVEGEFYNLLNARINRR